MLANPVGTQQLESELANLVPRLSSLAVLMRTAVLPAMSLVNLEAAARLQAGFMHQLFLFDCAYVYIHAGVMELALIAEASSSIMLRSSNRLQRCFGCHRRCP